MTAKVFKFGSSEKEFDIEFNSRVSNVVSLNNYRVWVLYDNGRHQIWQMVGTPTKPIKEGNLQGKLTDSFYLRALALFNDQEGKETVAFISDKPGVVQVLDINQDLILPNIKLDVPTALALPLNDRQDSLKVQSFRESTDLVTLPESDALVILERSPPGSQNSSYTVTIFGENINASTRKESNHKQMWLNRLNKRDKLILWNASCNDTPFQFFIINLKDNNSLDIEELATKKAYKADVVNVAAFRLDSFIFLMNQQDNPRPCYSIVDLRTKDEGKVEDVVHEPLDENSNGGCLSDTLYVNGYQGIILYEECCEKTIVRCIVHQEGKKPAITSNIIKDENGRIETNSMGTSPDSRLLVEVIEKYDPEARNKPKMKLKLRAHTLRGQKLSAYFIMKRVKLVDVYDFVVMRDLIEMYQGEFELR